LAACSAAAVALFGVGQGGGLLGLGGGGVLLGLLGPAALGLASAAAASSSARSGSPALAPVAAVRASRACSRTLDRARSTGLHPSRSRTSRRRSLGSMVANAVSSFCWAHTEARNARWSMPSTLARKALASRTDWAASCPLRNTSTSGVRLRPFSRRRTS
jgi:hypothetical protein